MGNRRERRAQASSRQAGADGDMQTMRPSDDPRNKVKPAKTLLEIAA